MAMKHQLKFEELIDQSVIDRYDDELCCNGAEAVRWTPVDTTQVWELLVHLLGELLTAEAIDEAYDRLLIHYDYDEEYEKEMRISDCRTAEDDAADWFEAVVRGEVAAEI